MARVSLFESESLLLMAQTAARGQSVRAQPGNSPPPASWGIEQRLPSEMTPNEKEFPPEGRKPPPPTQPHQPGSLPTPLPTRPSVPAPLQRAWVGVRPLLEKTWWMLLCAGASRAVSFPQAVDSKLSFPTAPQRRSFSSHPPTAPCKALLSLTCVLFLMDPSHWNIHLIIK